MAGTRGTNTMMEGIRKLYTDLADMDTYPDADPEFLSQAKELFLTKIKAAYGNAAAAAPGPESQMLGAAPAPPMMPPGMPAGMDLGMGGLAPGAVLAGGGAPSGNVPQGMPIPQDDELRRLLGG